MSARSRPRELVHAWGPAVFYMSLIFVISSMSIRAPFVEWLPLQDKLVHFVEFAVLGALLAFATGRTWPDRARWRTAAVAVLLGAAFGLSDEIHQSFVPGRDADPADLVADALGALLGAASFALATGHGRPGARHASASSAANSRADA